MRKYVFNGAVISAVASGWHVLTTTKNGPRDWRLPLLWVSWGLSVAIAIGTVMEENKEIDAPGIDD